MALVGSHYGNELCLGVHCLSLQENRRLMIVLTLRHSKAVDGLNVESRGVLRSV
jgi:hypothetical protein